MGSDVDSFPVFPYGLVSIWSIIYKVLCVCPFDWTSVLRHLRAGPFNFILNIPTLRLLSLQLTVQSRSVIVVLSSAFKAFLCSFYYALSIF